LHNQKLSHRTIKSICNNLSALLGSRPGMEDVHRWGMRKWSTVWSIPPAHQTQSLNPSDSPHYIFRLGNLSQTVQLAKICPDATYVLLATIWVLIYQVCELVYVNSFTGSKYGAYWSDHTRCFEWSVVLLPFSMREGCSALSVHSEWYPP